MVRALTFFLLGALVYSPASARVVASTSTSLTALAKAVEKFEQSPPSATESVMEKGESALTILRRPWISTTLLERAIKLYEEGGKTLNTEEEEEALFLLARHAFLLSHPSLENTIKELRNLPDDSPWRYRGIYVEALKKDRSGKSAEAVEIFESLESQFRSQDVRAFAILGHARLAFDAGNYEKAQELYKEIPTDSPAYPFALDEGAWAFVRTKDYDRASTNISLLFSLYPQSTLLPNAGYLIGRIYQDRTVFPDREKGALERLATRFGFEEESIDRSIEAFRGKEEEILFEFDPTLKPVEARSILPPLLRKELQKNLVIRSAIRGMQEIQSEKLTLAAGRNSVQAIGFALRGAGATTRQAVIFLEWANAIERPLLAVPREERLGLDRAIERTETIEVELRRAQDVMEEFRDRLLEIEIHLSLNWKFLGGSRQENALNIKKSVREQLQEISELMTEIARLRSLNTALNLRVRRQSAEVEAMNLTRFRSELHGEAAIFKKLDQLRRRVVKKDATDRAELQKKLKETRDELTRDIRVLKSREEELLNAIRPEIRRVLLESEQSLHRTLGKYRWSIAEAEYADLRRIEEKIQTHQLAMDKEQSELEERLRFSERALSPGIPLPEFPQSLQGVSPLELSKDLDRFVKSARLYMETIQNRISARSQADRKRYADFARHRFIQLVNRREIEREETLLSLQNLVKKHPQDPRTPYALYRLAQLHFDRAERLAGRLTTRNSPERTGFGDYNLVIEPLQRIERDFPKFPHRDSALYLLGYAYLQTDRDARAVHAFKKLVAEFPNSKLIPEVQLRIGEFYFSRREFGKARPHYQAVLSRGFNYFYDKALYKLAWSNYLTGRYDSAISYFLILLDYSDELPDQQREAFVEFQEEAEEYVAFSLYRSGGYQSAKRIFSKVGWKPYAFSIVRRMSEIAQDRGRERRALEGYALLMEKYPTHSDLPAVLRKRIEILENLNEVREARREKAKALKLVSEESLWMKENRNDAGAIELARSLEKDVLYSLATEYDVRGRQENDRTLKESAREFYTELLGRYPGTKEAYDSAYRQGEISFQGKEYIDAIQYYDQVVRSGSFGHHFSDSLFGIVVSRERVFSETKDGKEKATARENLVNSIVNFDRRAPHDRRAPEILYRLGGVLEEGEEYEESSKAYLKVFRKYPKSDFGRKGAIAAVNVLLKGERWADAASLSKELRNEGSSLAPQTVTELRSLEEGAQFKAALKLEKENKPAASMSAYFEFQKQFPDSTYAPTALFNAFVVSKREENFVEADRALALLLEKYPNAPESASARVEKAKVAEKLFHFKEAISLYASALKTTSNQSTIDFAASRLSKLFLASPTSSGRLPELFSEREITASTLSQIYFDAGRFHLRNGNSARAKELFERLARTSKYQPIHRALSSCELAKMSWNKGRTQDALYWERRAKIFRNILDEVQRDLFEVSWSEVEAERIENDAKFIRSLKVNTRNMDILMRSFQAKATRISQLEERVLSHAKRQHLHTMAKSLFHLGQVLYEFSIELSTLEPPPGVSQKDRKSFRQSVSGLQEPLSKKAQDVLDQSRSIHQKNRLPAPYVSELFQLISLVENKPAPALENRSKWVSFVFPKAPKLLVEEREAAPVAESGKDALVATVAVKDRTQEFEFIRQGVAAIGNIWRQKDRDDALGFFNRALEQNPRSVPALFNRAVVKIFDRDFQMAKQVLVMGVLKERSPEERALKGLLAWFDFDAKRMRAELKPISKHTFFGEWAREGVIAALILQSDRQGARQAAQEHLENTPSSLMASRLLAHAYEKMGLHDTARFILERVLTRDAQNPLLRTDLARLLGMTETLRMSALVSSVNEIEHPFVRSNWAHLGFEVNLRDEACGEWDDVAAKSGSSHPDLDHNLGLCRPEEERTRP